LNGVARMTVRAAINFVIRSWQIVFREQQMVIPDRFEEF